MECPKPNLLNYLRDMGPLLFTVEFTSGAVKKPTRSNPTGALPVTTGIVRVSDITVVAAEPFSKPVNAWFPVMATSPTNDGTNAAQLGEINMSFVLEPLGPRQPPTFIGIENQSQVITSKRGKEQESASDGASREDPSRYDEEKDEKADVEARRHQMEDAASALNPADQHPRTTAPIPSMSKLGLRFNAGEDPFRSPGAVRPVIVKDDERHQCWTNAGAGSHQAKPQISSVGGLVTSDYPQMKSHASDLYSDIYRRAMRLKDELSVAADAAFEEEIVAPVESLRSNGSEAKANEAATVEALLANVHDISMDEDDLLMALNENANDAEYWAAAKLASGSGRKASADYDSESDEGASISDQDLIIEALNVGLKDKKKISIGRIPEFDLSDDDEDEVDRILADLDISQSELEQTTARKTTSPKPASTRHPPSYQPTFQPAPLLNPELLTNLGRVHSVRIHISRLEISTNLVSPFSVSFTLEYSFPANKNQNPTGPTRVTANALPRLSSSALAASADQQQRQKALTCLVPFEHQQVFPMSFDGPSVAGWSEGGVEVAVIAHQAVGGGTGRGAGVARKGKNRLWQGKGMLRCSEILVASGFHWSGRIPLYSEDAAKLDLGPKRLQEIARGIGTAVDVAKEEERNRKSGWTLEYVGDLVFTVELLAVPGSRPPPPAKPTQLPQERPASPSKTVALDQALPVHKPMRPSDVVDAPSIPPHYLHIRITTLRSVTIPALSDVTVLLHLVVRMLTSAQPPVQTPPIPYMPPFDTTTGRLNPLPNFDYVVTVPVVVRKGAKVGPVVVEVRWSDVEGGSGLVGLVKLPVGLLWDVGVVSEADRDPVMVPETEYGVVDPFEGGVRGWVRAFLCLGTWDQVTGVAKTSGLKPGVAMTAAVENAEVRRERKREKERRRLEEGFLDRIEGLADEGERLRERRRRRREEIARTESTLLVTVHGACGIHALLDEVARRRKAGAWIARRQMAMGSPARDGDNSMMVDPTPYTTLDYAREVGGNVFVILRLFPKEVAKVCEPSQRAVRDDGEEDDLEDEEEEDYPGTIEAVIVTPTIAHTYAPRYEYSSTLTLRTIDTRLLNFIRSDNGFAIGEVWHRPARSAAADAGLGRRATGATEGNVLLGTFKVPLKAILERRNGVDGVWVPVEPADGEDDVSRKVVGFIDDDEDVDGRGRRRRRWHKGDGAILAAVEISIRFLAGFELGEIADEDGSFMASAGTAWTCRITVTLGVSFIPPKEDDPVERVMRVESNDVPKAMLVFARWRVPEERAGSVEYSTFESPQTPTSGSSADGLCGLDFNYIGSADIEMKPKVVRSLRDSKFEIQVFRVDKDGEELAGTVFVDLWEAVGTLRRNHRKRISRPIVACDGSFPLISSHSEDLCGATVAAKVEVCVVDAPRSPSERPKTSPSRVRQLPAASAAPAALVSPSHTARTEAVKPSKIPVIARTPLPSSSPYSPPMTSLEIPIQIIVDRAVDLPTKRPESDPATRHPPKPQKPNPFIKFTWQPDPSIPAESYQTHTIVRERNPAWHHHVTIRCPRELTALKRMKDRRWLRFECWDKRDDNSEEKLGELKVDLVSLLTGVREVNGWFELCNEEGRAVGGQVLIQIVPGENLGAVVMGAGWTEDAGADTEESIEDEFRKQPNDVEAPAPPTSISIMLPDPHRLSIVCEEDERAMMAASISAAVSKSPAKNVETWTWAGDRWEHRRVGVVVNGFQSEPLERGSPSRFTGDRVKTPEPGASAFSLPNSQPTGPTISHRDKGQHKTLLPRPADEEFSLSLQRAMDELNALQQIIEDKIRIRHDVDVDAKRVLGGRSSPRLKMSDMRTPSPSPPREPIQSPDVLIDPLPLAAPFLDKQQRPAPQVVPDLLDTDNDGAWEDLGHRFKPLVPSPSSGHSSMYCREERREWGDGLMMRNSLSNVKGSYDKEAMAGTLLRNSHGMLGRSPGRESMSHGGTALEERPPISPLREDSKRFEEPMISPSLLSHDLYVDTILADYAYQESGVPCQRGPITFEDNGDGGNKGYADTGRRPPSLSKICEPAVSALTEFISATETSTGSESSQFFEDIFPRPSHKFTPPPYPVMPRMPATSSFQPFVRPPRKRAAKTIALMPDDEVRRKVEEELGVALSSETDESSQRSAILARRRTRPEAGERKNARVTADTSVEDDSSDDDAHGFGDDDGSDSEFSLIETLHRRPPKNSLPEASESGAGEETPASLAAIGKVDPRFLTGLLQRRSASKSLLEQATTASEKLKALKAQETADELVSKAIESRRRGSRLAAGSLGVHARWKDEGLLSGVDEIRSLAARRSRLGSAGTGNLSEIKEKIRKTKELKVDQLGQIGQDVEQQPEIDSVLGTPPAAARLARIPSPHPPHLPNLPRSSGGVSLISIPVTRHPDPPAASDMDAHQSSFASFVASVPWKPIFQRLPGTWLLTLLPFAFLGPVYLPFAYASYFFILHVLFFLNNCRSCYAMYTGYNQAKIYSTTDWFMKYIKATGTVNGTDTTHDLPYDHVVHIIIIPNYKEDLDTLCETLDVLASHSRAVSQYKICLAMEEGETGCQQKASTCIKQYANSFYDITYTVHPLNRPSEIRGKSSNTAWAVSEMARRGGTFHEHEIVTVMDADTCFAEDYFASITYHYAVALPEQRKIMMFAATTVFDRNANQVPVFVRVTDMFWSIGVMSNLYPSSPVKIPCSAYSVSMDLVIAVGFWDAGPEAIGEDMHMYLKCFFCTGGRVIVKSIFSPASQCNIEGNGQKGISGWVSAMRARYTQARRHLWGSLDTGYALRRALLGILVPGYERVIQLKNAPVDKLGKEDRLAGFDLGALFSLFHRLLEAHILMGHFFVLMLISSFILPISSAISMNLATYLWSFLSTENVHPYVELVVNLGFWIRLACIPPNIVMFYYYEKYHQWVGFERWALQEEDRMDEIRTKMNHSQKSIIDPHYPQHSIHESDRRTGEAVVAMAGVTIPSRHRSLRVQHLGKRAQLASAREFPKSIFDWFNIPISGFLFYVVPQFDAQISQLWTDALVYEVAAKPQLARPPVHLFDNVKQAPSYSAPAPIPFAPAPPAARPGRPPGASIPRGPGRRGVGRWGVDDG
ncbi:hypothetical protein HK101_000257, partial [Irineochytrium annulatum]